MSAVELEKNWLAIYTQSRAEKKVEERLIREGIETNKTIITLETLGITIHITNT